MKCLGYGKFEGKCNNEAGTFRTPYWCERCDELRVKTITDNLKAIKEQFENKSKMVKG